MSILNAEHPAWSASGIDGMPLMVETSQYTTHMSGWLDAGVHGGPLWTMHTTSGHVLAYGPESIGYLDHLGRFDPIVELAHVPAMVEGDTVTFDAPGYLVTYRALVDRLKLTILLRAPLRAPNPDLVEPETSMLTLTGGMVLPDGLELRDRTGNVLTGDCSTTGELLMHCPVQNRTVQYLDRMRAVDAEGEHGHGELRLVTDADGSRRLFQGIGWAWLQVADYPVEIDPTVVTTSTSNTSTAYPSQQKNVRMSNGVLLTFFYDGTNTVCRYSTDDGQHWNTPTAGGTVTTASQVSVRRDSSDNIILVASNTTDVTIRRGVPTSTDNTGFTWSSGLVLNSGGTPVAPDVVVHTEGTGWTAHVVWADNSGGTFVRYRPVTISSSGTLSLGTAVALLTTTGTTLTYPSIAVDGNKNLYVTYTLGATGTGNGVRMKRATYSAGSWTWAGDEAVTESYFANQMGPCILDSTGRLVVTFRRNDTGNYLAVFRRAFGGGWSDISPTSQAGQNPGLAVDASDNYLLVYTNSGLKVRKYDGTTPWLSEVTADSTATAANPSVRRDTAGFALDAVYVTGSGSPYNVNHYRLSLNSPPTEPTLTVPTAFHAASGLTLTIQHNDPQGGNMTGYYLKVGSQWWNGTTLVNAEPAVPVSATGTSVSVTVTGLSAGTNYQVTAATVDDGGLKGPYNSIAKVTKASTKPTFSFNAPGATVNASKVTIQGSMTCGTGAVPASYIVRIYAANGTTVLDGPNTVTLAGALNYQDQYTLSNSTNYQVGVIPVDSDGLQGDEVKQAFATSFTPSNTPTIAVTADSDAFPPQVTITVANPPGGTIVTANRIERSTDNTNWVPMPDLCAVNGTFKDVCAKSGVLYYYRAVALGDNGTETASTAKTALVTRECCWFVPVNNPTAAIPFFWNRESSITDQRAFTTTETRGKYPVTGIGGRRTNEVDITATFVDDTFATPYPAVNMTAEEWRQRFEDLALIAQGYFCTPKGYVKRGILEPAKTADSRDMVVNPYSIAVHFSERGPVP